MWIKKVIYCLFILLIAFIIFSVYIVIKLHFVDNSKTNISVKTNLQKENKDKEISAYYQDYSEENYESAKRDSDLTVLFFYAYWCPTCRLANEDLKTDYLNLMPNTRVLKVDYDKYDDFRDTFNVGIPHTYVLIDKNGKELGRWLNGNVEEINFNIRKIMCKSIKCNWE